jgi:hypothetical protein
MAHHHHQQGGRMNRADVVAVPPTDPEKKAHLKQALERSKQRMPQDWKRLYPHLYASSPTCGKYCSPKEPAHFFLMFCSNRMQDEGYRDIDATKEPGMLMVQTLVAHAMPQLWISENLAQAIHDTTPAKDLHWLEMKLPHEAMTILLPKGALVHPTLGDVLFITYCRVKFTLEDGREGGRFYVLLKTEWHELLLDFGSLVIPVIHLGDLDGFERGITTRTAGEPRYRGFDIPLDSQDYHVQRHALHLLFGALLVMEERPHLVTQSRLLSRVQHKRGEPKEFWSPRVLGEHYKLQYDPKLPGGGHHSSPRLHWVAGHWRDQPHGPGRTLRRMTWIDPHTRGDEASKRTGALEGKSK